ncbi:XRE family transcriptional regulator [Meiothermus granaticius]|uniref:XRE family transcriptional regulator n=1 Tax=Meiothermus granaticius TaxID=863370 RepID=UPI001475CE78|nr:S24 family peptidase [Meiothermus granaticius]
MPEAKERPAWAVAIKRRREQLGFTQWSVVEHAGDLFGQTTVSGIERGDIHPLSLGAEKFFGLLRALRWSLAEFSQATGIHIDYIRETLASEAIERAGPDGDVYVLPVIDAGAGPPWSNDGADTVEIFMPELRGYDRSRLFVVRVHGDSMQGYADDGTLVICYRDGLPERGKVVAVWLAGDGVVIKRYLGVENGLLLLGNDNRAYRAAFEAPEGSTVIGVAIGRFLRG